MLSFKIKGLKQALTVSKKEVAAVQGLVDMDLVVSRLGERGNSVLDLAFGFDLGLGLGLGSLGVGVAAIIEVEVETDDWEAEVDTVERGSGEGVNAEGVVIQLVVASASIDSTLFSFLSLEYLVRHWSSKKLAHLR